MKAIDSSTLADLSLRAQSSPRARANLNVHQDLADPVQRFFNAIEPGSYLRPHRHRSPVEKWELFVIISGAAVVLQLDDAGTVLERVDLSADGECRVVEIPAGVWHTLAVTAPGTVLLEIKQGPYAPLLPEDFAAWAPAEGDSACAAMTERIANAQVGSSLRA